MKEHEPGCRSTLRELAVWYPARLSDAERREVEEHALDCVECRERIRFASAFQRFVRAEAGAHPGAEELVRYGESPGTFAEPARARMAMHLAACESCAEELAILMQVDEEEAPAGARTGAAAGVRVPEPTPWIRGWWTMLTGSLLQPAAALAYLVVAVTGVSMLVVERAELRAPRETVSGVLLVPDEAGVSRGAAGEASEAEILGSRGGSLLLELTNLSAPPASGALYRVSIMGAGATATGSAWTGEARGELFAANYSILISLPPGRLEPGSYEIAVNAPDGARIFRAGLRVR